jgi:hypothetical protein
VSPRRNCRSAVAGSATAAIYGVTPYLTRADMLKKKVTLSLDPDLNEALHRLAAREHRTVTAEVEVLIEREAKAKGELPKAWKQTTGRRPRP